MRARICTLQGARIGGLAVGAAPAGIRAPQPVANDDLKRLYDEWATEDEVEDHEGLLAPLRQQVRWCGFETVCSRRRIDGQKEG